MQQYTNENEIPDDLLVGALLLHTDSCYEALTTLDLFLVKDGRFVVSIIVYDATTRDQHGDPLVSTFAFSPLFDDVESAGNFLVNFLAATFLGTPNAQN